MEHSKLTMVASGNIIYIGMSAVTVEHDFVKLEKPMLMHYSYSDPEKQDKNNIELGLAPLLPSFAPSFINIPKSSMSWMAECEDKNIDDLYLKATTQILIPTNAEKKALKLVK